MTERELDMMDDYLSNRLSAEDKSAFEQQVQADPRLAQELGIQKGLVEGLKQARVGELKSMLNNIPVSPVSGGSSPLTKVGTLAVVAGLVVTAIYFYSAKEEETASGAKQISEQTPEVKPETEAVRASAPAVNVPEAQDTPEKPVAQAEKNKPAQQQAVTVTAPAKPDVFVPSNEADDATKKFEHAEMENIRKAFVTSSIVVETDTMSKRYNFHYVFKDSKLILYGAFEQNVYEILEFIGDEKRTVVLFYKSNYYLLDIARAEPTKLSPIRDQKLLKMLKAHRGK